MLLLLALSAPAQADVSVYFQFGSGMVVLVPRHDAYRWYHARRGIIVQALPYGYVAQPYSYYYGRPAYYPRSVWVSHHRHWRGEPDWSRHDHGHHDHGRHEGWNPDRDHHHH